MGVRVAYTKTGPLFDGSLARRIERLVDEVEDEVAQFGYDEVQRRLGRSLRRPTGRYQSRVTVQRRGDTRLVTDGGVVYGPWLEGVSRRNRTTRFRGYRSFRLAAQAVDREAPRIAERAIERGLR